MSIMKIEFIDEITPKYLALTREECQFLLNSLRKTMKNDVIKDASVYYSSDINNMESLCLLYTKVLCYLEDMETPNE